MSTVIKGRIAAAKVTSTLTEQEWEVYLPAFDNGVCDLVALRGAEIARVEVKYAGFVKASGSVEVHLRQIRANRAEMQIKNFNAENSDWLGMYFAPFDLVAFHPASSLHGRTTLTWGRSQVEQHTRMDKPMVGDGTALEKRRA